MHRIEKLKSPLGANVDIFMTGIDVFFQSSVDGLLLELIFTGLDEQLLLLNKSTVFPSFVTNSIFQVS